MSSSSSRPARPRPRTPDGPRAAPPSPPPIAPGSLAAWAVAARPRTLWIAMIPVIVGTALARMDGASIDWTVTLLALLVSVIMQVVSNLENDVGFTLRGGRTTGHTGLPRATANGWLTAGQVRGGIAVLLAVALVLGLPLVLRSGWPVLAMGVASMIGALSYMGGPRPLAYTPLGELGVFVFFGLIAVCGTVYLHAGHVSLESWIGGAAIGALAAAVLAVNNHRDIAHDRTTGRRTFAVTFGPAASVRLYAWLIASALLLSQALALIAGSAWLALPLLTAPAALRLVREMNRSVGGPGLNVVLLRTVMLEVAFGALLAMGALLHAAGAGLLARAHAQAAAGAQAGTQAAASFPQRTVRIVVPYSVGLGPDIVARAVAESMSQAWKQPVVVENRPGASGIVALAEVRKVAPDGHTLFVGDAGSIAANPHLYPSLPYDPVRDLVPVSTLFRATFVVFTGQKSRFNTLPELVDAAKREPGRVSYASFGAGHPSQLAMEMLAQRAGIEMLHVPFKDAGQLVGAIATGDVDVTPLSMNSAGALAKAGRMKALAVGSRKRLPDYPDLPTLAEVGIPGVELAPWAALFAVAGTPPEVVQAIHRETVAALRNPEIRGRIEGLGFEVTPSSPEQLAQLARSDSALYSQLIRSRGLKPE